MSDSLPDQDREQRWREAVDRYFAPAGMALADREQDELRAENERITWVKGHWLHYATAVREDRDGLRERLTRAEAIIERLRAARAEFGPASFWSRARPLLDGLVITEGDPALSADENGTRDE